MVWVFQMDYTIVLDPDPEDGGYVVHCPALPGCYSQSFQETTLFAF